MANRQRNAEYKRKSRQARKCIARHGLNTFNETAVKIHDIGQMNYICPECGAQMFKEEQSRGFSFCCSHGSVKLPPIKEPPQLLKCLLTGTTQTDHNFRENIRAYNSGLAFASTSWVGPLGHHWKLTWLHMLQSPMDFAEVILSGHGNHVMRWDNNKHGGVPL